ncbi:hypothetical protein CSOJ01_15076 [Colletotrichum sojae]|uniref:Small secreted protein n=1 Tax=Colletotrichum sojae TaxID=2175907 RepID=A0A8H6IP42_9PEZI|nr:hypothetical protein CSOJ01_15076 [Colletotrichum sojae]
MHFTTLLPFLLTSASALKVAYYYDGGCKDHAVTPPSAPTKGTCYNYEWTNSNSAKITQCNPKAKRCGCAFYPEANCKGSPWLAHTDPGAANCASNWGHGFKSFGCTEVY